MVLSTRCDTHEGIPVDWFTLGHRDNAVQVILDRHKDGIYMRLDHRYDLGSLDCAEWKFEDGVEIVAWKCHKGGNQWFTVNPDLTISPTHSPNLCLAYEPDDDNI